MSTITGNKYIVVFKDGVTKEQITKYVQTVDGSGGKVTERYDEGAGILNGFAAVIPDSYFTSLKGDDLVSYIEPDGVVTIQV